MRMIFISMFAIAVLVIALPVQVIACACCAERGTYIVNKSEYGDSLEGVMENTGFASSILYTDAGYPDNILGIDPLGDDFSVNGDLSGKAWTLQFTDNANRRGSLTLWRPEKVEEFMVDRTPLEERPTVILYKEMRLGFRVQSATGFFKDGVDAHTEYKLILQGEGNMCANPGDYKTYFLHVRGESAKYTFFGKLKVKEDTAMQKRGDVVGTGAAEISGAVK